MNLMWIIGHALTCNLIKNRKKSFILHHCEEADNYTHLIKRLKGDVDYVTYSFFNRTIGDYLTIDLPKIIRELEPIMARTELQALKDKREELIGEYNNWFFKRESMRQI